jgi:5-methylcytosine-specific restriction protein A
MDEALRVALSRDRLVRVIVNSGTRRLDENPDASASSVRRRQLDPEPWTVISYDDDGTHTLMRGRVFDEFADQHTLAELSSSVATRRERIVSAFDRGAATRAAVRRRSRGKCEYCQAQGFRLPDGRIYIESHHIVPLSEEGLDQLSNMIALCPNHHREAHYGQNRNELRSLFRTAILSHDASASPSRR